MMFTGPIRSLYAKRRRRRRRLSPMCELDIRIDDVEMACPNRSIVEIDGVLMCGDHAAYVDLRNESEV